MRKEDKLRNLLDGILSDEEIEKFIKSCSSKNKGKRVPRAIKEQLDKDYDYLNEDKKRENWLSTGKDGK